MTGDHARALSAAEIATAKALLGWSTSALALRAEVSFEVAFQAELVGTSKMDVVTANALRAAFEMEGIEFPDGARPGVRLRKAEP